MSSRRFKKQLFEQFARVGKAVSSAHRLEILELLAQSERTVETLAQLTSLPIANVSQHLQYLRKASLVSARKVGLYVHYRLATPVVSELLSVIQKVAERQLDEVNELVHAYLTSKDNLEPMSRVALLERAREGLVTVLDVRPPEEFATGHVPGAINIPLKDLPKRLREFPRNREIVAYCRGPFCILAFEAVAQLRAKGFKARRLEEGFPEWQNANLPVATGALGE